MDLSIYKKIYYKYLPFLILGGAVLLLHAVAGQHLGGDDVHFYGVFTSNDFDFFNFLATRYNTWSSRLLIESTMVPLLVLPRFIWILADSFLFTALGILIVNIINPEKFRTEISFLVVSLLLVFNFHDITDTGWITTTVNYLWPLTLGLWVLEHFVDINRCSKFHVLRYLISIPIVLFAANMELVCITMLSVSCGYFIYWAFNRRFSGYALFVFLLAGASLVFTLTCPGNAARFAHDASTQFYSLGFFQKVEIGASLVLTKLILVPNPLFLCLCFLSGILVLNTKKPLLIKVAGMVPVVFSVAMAALYALGADANLEHGKVTEALDIISKYGIAMAPPSRMLPISVVLGIFSTVAIAMLALNFLIIFEDKTQTVVLVGILALGMATKASLGFSPTAWASGERTSLLLSISLILLFGFLLKKWNFEDRSSTRMLQLLVGCCALGFWLFHAANLMNFSSLL